MHEVNDLSKESHGVFYGDSVNTINKAWNNKSNGIKISGESVDTYIIPYENAGYAGRYGGQRQNLNSITIITQKNSDKLITGFPGNGYEYSLDGIIGEHVGKALYEYGINYAKEKECYNVTLNVWQGNGAAESFYKSMGMKIQKTGMEYIL